MNNNPTLKIRLILLCILLHIFNGVGLFYTHPTISKQLFIFHNKGTELIEICTKVSLFARILGGYFLGKISDKYGFNKTMQIICLAYFFISILIGFLDKLDFLQGASLLCLVHALHSFLRVSSLIIPTIYIFHHCKNDQEIYKYSAFAWLFAFAGMALINLFVTIFVNMHSLNWCFVYALDSIISFIIYCYIKTFPEVKWTQPQESISKYNILLAFLFAGICGSGLLYQFYVIDHYVKDVMIVETAGQQVIYSPFWITLFFMILPAIKIIKSVGIVNTIFISLLGILFSVSLLCIAPLVNYYTFFTHQVIFAIFFSLFLSPTLAFIYQLLQKHNSYFLISFTFNLGFTCFGGITFYTAILNFLPVPFLGASIIILLMLTCLLILFYKKDLLNLLNTRGNYKAKHLG